MDANPSGIRGGTGNPDGMPMGGIGFGAGAASGFLTLGCHLSIALPAASNRDEGSAEVGFRTLLSAVQVGIRAATDGRPLIAIIW